MSTTTEPDVKASFSFLFTVHPEVLCKAIQFGLHNHPECEEKAIQATVNLLKALQ